MNSFMYFFFVAGKTYFLQISHLIMILSLVFKSKEVCHLFLRKIK